MNRTANIMKFLVSAFFVLVLSACTVEHTVLAANGETIQGSSAKLALEHTNVVRIKPRAPEQVYEALEKLGLNEYQHRTVLQEYIGVDPKRVQWCAAFVNAVLQESELPDNYDHPNPYMARSFLEWGEAVDSPQQGDVVVFPRGNTGWKGHVGFYLDSVVMNDTVYYRILGGNQGNSVSIDLYLAHTALGIRRAE
jgi:uncharacterized protein (TIGR02594 family)